MFLTFHHDIVFLLIASIVLNNVSTITCMQCFSNKVFNLSPKLCLTPNLNDRESIFIWRHLLVPACFKITNNMFSIVPVFRAVSILLSSLKVYSRTVFLDFKAASQSLFLT